MKIITTGFRTHKEYSEMQRVANQAAAPVNVTSLSDYKLYSKPGDLFSQNPLAISLYGFDTIMY